MTKDTPAECLGLDVLICVPEPRRNPTPPPPHLHPHRYRDGEPIPAKSSEFQISRDGEYYSMTFSNVKEAHQGNYSVMAKNSQGENSSSMHLTVYSKFPPARPASRRPFADGGLDRRRRCARYFYPRFCGVTPSIGTTCTPVRRARSGRFCAYTV